MSSKRKRCEEAEVDKGFIARMDELSEGSTEGFDDMAVKRAALFLEYNYYEAALTECERVLELLHKNVHAALAHLSDVASASVLRGRALLEALTKKLAHEGEEDDAIMQIFRESRAAFSFALILSPDNSAAQSELTRLQSLELELFGENGAHQTSGSEAAKDPIHSCPSSTINASEVEAQHRDQSNEERSEHSPSSAEGVADDDDPVIDKSDLDVVIVGAGASGIGVGLALVAHFGIHRDRMLVLERGDQVGRSFRLWPKEMRFISPSFNQQGWTSSFDLNSVAHGTSPATYTLEEHPTGEQYAQYLQALAVDASLPIRFCMDVASVRPVGSPGNPRFEVHAMKLDAGEEVAKEDSDLRAIFRCRFLVWAAGEFQYPKCSSIFPGAELCCHNSTVRSWSSHPGEDFVVIGGYESGIDAAVNLVSSNRPVTVLASSSCWEEQSRDPSAELSPHTRARLKQVLAGKHAPKLRLLGGQRVTKVECKEKQYMVYVSPNMLQEKNQTQKDASERALKCYDEPVCVTSSPPILSVGFEGSVSQLVRDLFDWEQVTSSGPDKCNTDVEDELSRSGSGGSIILTEEDESTKTEGLFLVGPQVTHENLIFCFIYKFRQRFAVVAAEVSRRLGKDIHMGVMTCRSADMFLDNFAGIHACCDE